VNAIFDGDLSTAKSRAVAWIDSLFIDHAVLRLLWGNLATVVPGKIYRCNHSHTHCSAKVARSTNLSRPCRTSG
jgi:hypothetical protein